jgi:hypothetical protein
VTSPGFPIVFNFRVENDTPTRVYFDSSESITGSTVTGFTISGKTVTNVFVNGSNLTGHYFTCSTAFTFWEQAILVKYDGGSNIVDSDSNALHAFALQGGTNNMIEPPTSSNKYVSALAGGGGTGTEGDPYTWAEMGNLLSSANSTYAGTTFWVKAGDYNNPTIPVIRAYGTSGNPIKIIGYKTTTGDITTPFKTDIGNGSAFNYTSHTVAETQLLDTEYPVITGTSTTGVYGFALANSEYFVIKNIIINRYVGNYYFYNQSSRGKNVYLENLVGANSWQINSNNGGNIIFQSILPEGTYTPYTNVTIKNCVLFDAGSNGIQTDANNVLVEGNDVYCSNHAEAGTGQDGTDYYFTTNEMSNSVLRNNQAIRYDLGGNQLHGGHAAGGKSSRGVVGKIFMHIILAKFIS